MRAVGIALFIIGVITGIQTPFWVGCILAALVMIFLSSNYVKSQELGALIYIYWGGLFIIGMIAGDVYVFVWYPELRPNIPFWNPFLPPGAK